MTTNTYFIQLGYIAPAIQIWNRLSKLHHYLITNGCRTESGALRDVFLEYCELIIAGGQIGLDLSPLLAPPDSPITCDSFTKERSYLQ